MSRIGTGFPSDPMRLQPSPRTGKAAPFVPNSRCIIGDLQWQHVGQIALFAALQPKTAPLLLQLLT
jgi:hypothetical protein